MGASLELTLTSTHLVGEWQNLRVVTPYAEIPQRGFSGAAVYGDTTGEVIGMITDHSTDPKKLTGRMLPVQMIRRHWEELDDLLDLSWLPRQERQELRRIVTGATSGTDLRQLMCRVFPGTGGHRDFYSVWDAIRHVGEELHGEDRLARFLSTLARTLTPEAAQWNLKQWSRDYLSADAGPAEPETSVIVRLDPVREGYDLDVSALIDNEPAPQSWRTAVSGGAELRAQVETGLAKIKRQVAGTTPMIEFVLPRSLLNEPVEEWEYGRDTPVITQRAVLRYVDRLTDIDEWDPWAARTKSLRARTPEDPQLVGCRGDDPTRLYMRLKKASDVCVLVYATRPDETILGKALHAGLPVIIWSRDPCPEIEHEICQAARHAACLVAQVAATTPAGLPELVRIMRLDAYEKPDEPHHGRNLALLWDDPERMPDPPAYMPDL